MPVDDVAARGFGAGAAAYEAARPGYPDEAIAVLVDEVGIRSGTTVCDLAAGTGKLTRRLLEIGAGLVPCGRRARLRFLGADRELGQLV